MIYQFVWTSKNEGALERSVPLLWNGIYMARNGLSNGINVCFLEGIDKISKSYRNKLAELGYNVLDCTALVSQLLDEYPQLREFATTSRYWFLRWNVLETLTRKYHDCETVVHLDGDVVLLADPKDILEDVKGKTFVLQGCPAFTAITGRKWFENWRNELLNFLRDPPAYKAESLRLKENPLKDPREYCNELAYMSGRFEDQDMLEYLVAAGKLPQATAREVYDSRFYWIQNPLFPGSWHKEQGEGAPKRVVLLDHFFHVGEKRIPFYHFQSDFTRFCDNWLAFYKIGLSRFVSSGHLNPENGSSRTSNLLMNALHFLRRLQPVNRRGIQESVFRTNYRTGNLYIVDLINDCWG